MTARRELLGDRATERAGAAPAGRAYLAARALEAAHRGLHNAERAVRPAGGDVDRQQRGGDGGLAEAEARGMGHTEESPGRPGCRAMDCGTGPATHGWPGCLLAASPSGTRGRSGGA